MLTAGEKEEDRQFFASAAPLPRKRTFPRGLENHIIKPGLRVPSKELRSSRNSRVSRRSRVGRRRWRRPQVTVRRAVSLQSGSGIRLFLANGL